MGKSKIKIQLEFGIPNVVHFFNATVHDYIRKEADKNYPSGPWRSDTEFGTLLGIRATAQNLLGDVHPTVLYFREIIDAIVNDKTFTLRGEGSHDKTTSSRS